MMKDFPIIKTTIFFIIGILSYKIFSFPILFYFCYAATSIVVIFLFIKIRINQSIISAIVFMLIIFAGNFITKEFYHNQIFLPSKFNYTKNLSAIGEITNIELNKDKGIVFYLITDSIKINDKPIRIRTKLLCRLNDVDRHVLDSIYAKINIGNKIKITGNYSIGREQRNPGEFDYSNYLHLKDISGVLTSYDVKKFEIIQNDRSLFQSTLFDIRKSLNRKITSLHSLQAAALIKGLLLADRSEISSETKVQFINAGVMHVLAVSGLHVGYILIIFYLLFGRLNIYFRSMMIMLGLIFFMLLTGLPSSVVRAVVMAAVIVISQITNRSTNLFNSLSLAALIILFITPSEIYNPSFQLSFAAVFSIAAIAPFFQSRINNFKIKSSIIKNFLLFISVSLSAQIGTLPFTLIYFNKLSITALIANLVVIPVVGIIVGIAIFTLALSYIAPALAGLSAITNNFVTFFLFNFIRIAGGTKLSFISIKGFSLADAILFYLFIALLFFFNRYFTKKISKIIFIVLIFLNIFVYCSHDKRIIFPKNLLTIFMTDVGQGDAYLIHFPNGQNGLVDAGVASSFFDTGEKIITPLLDYFNIDHIDYAFISHIDSDHYGGIISLIQEKKIKKIYFPSVDTASNKEKKFLEFLIQHHIPFEHYNRRMFSAGNVRIYFLNDSPSFINKKTTSNDRSLVMKVLFGNTGVLFTGDIDFNKEEYYLRKYKKFLSSDVLKVSHHGSGRGSSDNFINAVKPKISLISVGIKNKFGHPSSEVLNRLKEIKSRIIRTDIDGGSLLISNGENFKCINWRTNNI